MQSHFVKLEPPYQIIHYGGVVGIQIGTLIVVGKEYPGPDDRIDIYTRSHPVVSYVDKNMFKHRMGNRRADPTRAAYWGGGEGNVWSKVDVNDVDVLGLWDNDQNEDSYPFGWDDFVVLVADGFSHIDAMQNKYREYGIYNLRNYLEKVGFGLVLPDPVEHLEMKMMVRYNKVGYGRILPTLYCETNDGLIAFELPFYKSDVERIAPMMVHFMQQYLSIMKSSKATVDFYIGEPVNDNFVNEETRIKDNEALELIVKALNNSYNEKSRK